MVSMPILDYGNRGRLPKDSRWHIQIIVRFQTTQKILIGLRLTVVFGFPPAGNHATIAAPPDNILPFPTVAIMANNFQLTQLPENLLIVVSNGAQLEAVFSAAERANIVVWLWWCAELTAQRVEDYFPAIYGRPTAEAITEAFKDGAGQTNQNHFVYRSRSNARLPECSSIESP